jgi:thiol:disulfide interchange protein DsbD
LGGDAVTADIFNWLATHWIPNVIFFIIFMVFAASFFGAFEITMPSWMVNKTDAKSDKGGLVGVFFMALTLVLVSFSCTGPIVSSVLIKSTQGEIWEPIITMFAFSAAFALPFTVFAFAPSLLKDLPKSGGWLNSVKVVLGFIEVALGLKFLSVADQVYQWNLLDREVYLAIWIVVFSLLGLYLLGKLRFAHDTPEDHISVKRLFLAIVVFSFVVYMIPGMWGAPLKALSGYLPPIESMDFNLSKQNVVMQQVGAADHHNNPYPAKKFTDMGLKHIDGIPGFFDLQEALEYSKTAGKPVFIDFTGAACVNCREMESRVFSDPQIKEILNNQFVFVSLYGDVKTEVAESDWVTLPNGKVLKSLGKINTNFIMEKYKVNAMPYYIITDAQGNQVVEPRGYDLDKDAFKKFLENAVETFNK